MGLMHYNITTATRKKSLPNDILTFFFLLLHFDYSPVPDVCVCAGRLSLVFRISSLSVVPCHYIPTRLPCFKIHEYTIIKHLLLFIIITDKIYRYIALNLVYAVVFKLLIFFFLNNTYSKRPYIIM